MKNYYTDQHLRTIRESENIQDFLAIALEILDAMNKDHPDKPIAMICGPISTGGTGSREKNLLLLDRTIQRLKTDKLFVFSQMPFENDIGRLYQLHPELRGLRLLEEFCLPIFESGYIKLTCFIPNWQSSFGAKWEFEQAKRLGIPRILLADSYIQD